MMRRVGWKRIPLDPAERGKSATSAVLGGNRRCCRSGGYPAVTRVQKDSESLGRVDLLVWFGTEGSEVQILSPRPIPNKTCRI